MSQFQIGAFAYIVAGAIVLDQNGSISTTEAIASPVLVGFVASNNTLVVKSWDTLYILDPGLNIVQTIPVTEATGGLDIVALNPQTGDMLVVSNSFGDLVFSGVVTPGGMITAVDIGTPVLGVAYSPDGALLWVGGSAVGGHLRCYDTATWLPAAVPAGLGDVSFTYNIQSMVISPDGRWLSLLNNNYFPRVYSLETGDLVLADSLEYGAGVVASFQPGGDLVALPFGYNNPSLKVVDLASAELLYSLDIGSEVYSAAFTGIGSQLVVGSNTGTGFVMDAATGTHVRDLVGYTSDIVALQAAAPTPLFWTNLTRAAELP